MLTKVEREQTMLNLPAARHYASRSLDPATHDERTVVIGMIAPMPSQNVAEEFGPAAINLYHMGLNDLPADLLMLAVERAVKASKWRPQPHDLQNYVCEEFAERKRRLQRLDVMAVVQTPEEKVAERPLDTAAILAKLNEQLNVGHNKLMGVDMPGYRSEASRKRHLGPPRAPTREELDELRNASPPATSDASPSLKALAAKLAGQVAA